MSTRGFKQESMRAWLYLRLPSDVSYPGSEYYGVSFDQASGQQWIKLDILRFSATFAVNSIPESSCSVAMGLDVTDTSKASNIHNIMESLVYRTPAKIYLSVSQGFEDLGNLGADFINRETIFDGKPFVVFDGYMTGAGYRRSGNSVEYVISIQHWLSDLTTSSALSPDMVPGVPFNTLFPSTGYTPEADNSGLTSTQAEQAFRADSINDLWGKGIKNYFLKMAKLNVIGRDLLGTGDNSLANLFNTDTNQPAIDALDRFINKPLKLEPGFDSAATHDQIFEYLRSMTLFSFDGSTFWDNIITLGSSLLFQVIPTINKTVVAPRLSSYRVPYITLKSSEITTFDISTAMPRFISGVVLRNRLGPDSLPTSDGLNREKLGTQQYFTKKVKPDNSVDPSKRGAIIVQRAPEWMCLPFSTATTPNQQTGYLTQTASLAAAALSGVAGATAAVAAVASNNKKLGYAYANAVFANEVLKYRNGNISGKFRLDVAPGSIVKIQTAGDNPLDIDNKYDEMYACVDSVTIYLDSTVAQAYTSFGISSVRSAKENEDNDLTLTSNPLYSTTWSGCSLYIEAI